MLAESAEPSLKDYCAARPSELRSFLERIMYSHSFIKEIEQPRELGQKLKIYKLLFCLFLAREGNMWLSGSKPVE